MTATVRSPAAAAQTARPGRPRAAAAAVWAGAALTVASQIPYPLLHGAARDRLTVASVLFFAATTVGCAALAGGRRAAAGALVVPFVLGLAAEAAGIRTGLPFGRYRYTGGLGWSVLGVPMAVPLAWTMMAYPALVIARAAAGGRLARALVGGAGLVAWDLFLDPQMIAAGHWRWLHPGVSLPGTGGVPVSNYLGWFVVGALLTTALDALLPTGDPAGTRPAEALYLWTFGSSVLANLAFFHRPAVAGWGGLAMGAVVAAAAVGRRSRT